MDHISKVIGNNIRKYRKSHKMTREQLAEALNLDTAYLGQCERGERQLGLGKTIEIIEFFGLSANDIISVKVPPKTEQKDSLVGEINQLLNECSDNQLLAVRNAVSQLLPFLKE